MEQNWPVSQISANCNSVSFEICPLYCHAFNEAILMFMKLFSGPASASHSEIIDKEFSRTISSYAHVEEDDLATTETPSQPKHLILFVSNVPTVSVRIFGHDATQSDCSLLFMNSRTSLVVHPDDVESYMSVMQVTCCNNLQPASCPSHAILSVNGGVSQAAALLHFWYAEEGSSLWSDKNLVGSKTVVSTGPSLGLSLICADAELNIDLFRYQGLIDLISNNLDAFSPSIKEDLSRKVEFLIAEVKNKMNKTGSSFSFDGKFSKLVANMFSGSNSFSVLAAELNHSAVKLVFSEGSTIDFCVSSDAFKLCDCMTHESQAPFAIVESSSHQSLQLSGIISGNSLSVTAKLCKFHSSLFAPAVAKMWLILFPPSALAHEALAALKMSRAATTKIISISLVFEGAEILFCDNFMSRSGFCLTAPTMQLSCLIENQATSIKILEGADAFRIDAVLDEDRMQVLRSDGSISLIMRPSSHDLHCPVKTLSVYVSDRLLDYAIPFIRNVLGSAASFCNAEEIVDNIIQQHSGTNFCVSTGAKALCLYLGDSSASQLFVPLFEVSLR
jgi:hypothetical protein